MKVYLVLLEDHRGDFEWCACDTADEAFSRGWRYADERDACRAYVSELEIGLADATNFVTPIEKGLIQPLPLFLKRRPRTAKDRKP
jgi:hypothetical protein